MIHVDFVDFDDMMNFARSLAGSVPAEAKTPVQPAPPMLNPAPVPPAAPVDAPAVPVAPSTPVAAPVVSTAVPTAPAPVQSAPAPVQPAPVTAVPTTPSSYTLDDLARAAMTLMDAGRQNELQGLLRQFGVDSLPALPPQQYGAFATALRGMGAQI